MRVLLATTAGAGHFAPLVPFAHACAGAGHEVRVAAPESFAAAVVRAGLAHAPVDDAAPAAVAEVFARIPELTMPEANSLVVREVFGRLDPAAALPGMRALVETWQPDVVLREPAEIASYVVAAEHDLPYVEVNIGLDSFSDRLVELLEEPLRELGCTRGTAAMREAPRWTLLPASFDVDATMSARAPTRFREATGPVGAPGALPDWWGDLDDPLVYVSFGSVAAGLGLFPRFYAEVLDALGDARVRVLMTLGEAGAPEQLGTLPDNVHVERWWPQGQVMPHADAIVAHGGFGTTMLALAAGVPQVVVPLFAADQFANATRVHELRAGLALQEEGVAERRGGAVIPAGPAVLDSLPDAVERVLHDAELRHNARAIAADIAALPAAAGCVRALEELVAARG
jgi:UDP:flavonoid glycosyltransferase YjiC (YdhE family)